MGTPEQRQKASTPYVFDLGSRFQNKSRPLSAVNLNDKTKPIRPDLNLETKETKLIYRRLNLE